MQYAWTVRDMLSKCKRNPSWIINILILFPNKSIIGFHITFHHQLLFILEAMNMITSSIKICLFNSTKHLISVWFLVVVSDRWRCLSGAYAIKPVAHQPQHSPMSNFTLQWTSRHLKSTVTRLFVQHIVYANTNANLQIFQYFPFVGGIHW